MQSKFELILDRLRIVVQNLYDYRNNYSNEFVEQCDILNENNDAWLENLNIDSIISESFELNRNKSELLETKFKETLATLNEYESEFSQASGMEKAEFCYLNGRVLNAIQPEPSVDGTTVNVMDLLSQTNQWLTRALKFNPRHVDAWCELGDTCWRQGDLIEAANHFRQVLKINAKHTETLCHFSMITRQLSALQSGEHDTNGTVESNEKVKKCPFNKSIQLAHKAVSQNPANGYAWSMLGNALLTKFFNSFGFIAPPPSTPSSNELVRRENSNIHTEAKFEQLAKTASPPPITTTTTSAQLLMTRCLAAYAQATKDRVTALESHFHYNRALAWHYQGNFNQALRCWLRSICIDPDWLTPQSCVLRLINFLLECERLMKEYTNLTIKSKNSKVTHATDKNYQSKLPYQTQIGDFIQPMEPLLNLICPNEGSDNGGGNSVPNLSNKSRAILNRLLGSYNPHNHNQNALIKQHNVLGKKTKNASRYASFGQSHHPFFSRTLFKFVLFNHLQIGPNTDRMCVGRVLTELPSDSDFTLNLMLVDASGTLMIARLFNIGKGLGPVRKDIITIPHPFVEEILIERYVLHSSFIALKSVNDRQFDNVCEKFSIKFSTTANRLCINNKEGDECLLLNTESNMDHFRLKLVRIPLPDVLVVNGHSVGASWTATPILNTIFFTGN